MPRPSSMSSSSAAAHCSPSRQGVHQPHDSWAKNCSRLRVMPTGQVWSSRTTSVPVPEAAADLLHGAEVHGDVDVRGGDERRGGPSGADGAQLVAGQHAARVHLDELAHRGAHGQLHAARPRHAPGDAVDLGAALAGHRQALPPVGAVAHDGGHGGEGLDVVHHGRTGEQAGARHVRRPRARVGPLALEGVEHRRRLAADVAPDALVQVDVEGEARAEDVAAEVAALVGLGDGPLDAGERLVVLGAQKDVAGVRLDGEAGEDHALEHAGAGCARAGSGP